MKQLTLLLALVLCSIVNAQGCDTRNTTISTVVSPGSWDDGFGLGIQLEHQNRTIYIGPELYSAPTLNANKDTPSMGYYHAIGRFGFNHHFTNRLEETVVRLFAGGRGGAILRENEGVHALLGGEIGFDVKLVGPIYFRFTGTMDAKTDSTIWSNSPSHTVYSVIGGLGIRF